MLISSVLQILDLQEVHGRSLPDKTRSKDFVEALEEIVDGQDAGAPAGAAARDPSAPLTVQPARLDHGNPDGSTSKDVFSEFLRAVEEVSKSPPPPVLDLFQ